MKKIISIVLSMIILASLITSTGILNVSATDNSNIKWSFDSKTGTLTISGTGEMDDYVWSSDVPWYRYMRNISSVTINKGITSIGKCAFWGCSSLTSITISSSVTTISSWAFNSC